MIKCQISHSFSQSLWYISQTKKEILRNPSLNCTSSVTCSHHKTIHHYIWSMDLHSSKGETKKCCHKVIDPKRCAGVDSLQSYPKGFTECVIEALS